MSLKAFKEFFKDERNVVDLPLPAASSSSAAAAAGFSSAQQVDALAEIAAKKKPKSSLRDKFTSSSFEAKPKSLEQHVELLKRQSAEQHVQQLLKRPSVEAKRVQELLKRPRGDAVAENVVPEVEEPLLKKHRSSVKNSNAELEPEKKHRSSVKNSNARDEELDNAEVDDCDSGESVSKVRRDLEAELVIRSTSVEGPYVPLVLEEESEGTKKIEVPPSINSRLLDHQREGVRFLYRLYRENKGGILGDDMGLGKTIQSIAFLAGVLRKDDDYRTRRDKSETRKAVLILCPTSVIENWQREFEVWGDFNVGVYHGAKRETIVRKVNADQLDVVLTSHDTFRIHGSLLLDIHWDCVIVDEAHRLKNEKSKLYQACVQIRTPRKYGLTGTILQNKFLELFNVFQWAAPGCLGTKEHFRNNYDEPIKQGQRISAPALVVELAEKRKSQLLNVLKKHLLRRTKDDTIGHLLRGKEDIVVFCAMSPVQKRVYTRLLESPDFQCLVRKNEPCDCGSLKASSKCCLRTAPEGTIWQYLHRNSTDGCKMCPYCLVLPCLTKLQQVSNHLELLKPKPQDEPEKRSRDEAFASLVFGEDAELLGGVQQTDNFVGLSDARHCGKMLALNNLLTNWTDRGDKILLFSYSVRMLEILERFLIRKGYCFCRLDGSTPMNTRQAIVDEFNTSPSKQVFLISTRAGGLGLNLVSANRVVIFDPNWNPAQDLQAQDRSFRFGQKQHVTVFRLLAAGSLEELIYTRQIYKQHLFNIAVTGTTQKRYFEGVQDSKNNQGELFGVSNLFRDLKESVFTSDIIGHHAERMTQQMKLEPGVTLKAQKLKLPKAPGDEEEDEHGLSLLAKLLKPDVEDETEDRADIASILTDTGVVYAHRNEEVVNMHASERAEAASEDEEDLEEEVVNRTRTAKQSRAVPDAVKAKTGRKPVTRTVENRARLQRDRLETADKPLKVDDKTDSGVTNRGENKREQFLELARFKGMDEKSFSKWLVSASQEQRSTLLASFKASKL